MFDFMGMLRFFASLYPLYGVLGVGGVTAWYVFKKGRVSFTAEQPAKQQESRPPTSQEWLNQASSSAVATSEPHNGKAEQVRSFSDAVRSRILTAIDEAKVELAVSIPIEVKDGQLHAEVTDGVIGHLLLGKFERGNGESKTLAVAPIIEQSAQVSEGAD